MTEATDMPLKGSNKEQQARSDRPARVEEHYQGIGIAAVRAAARYASGGKISRDAYGGSVADEKQGQARKKKKGQSSARS